MPAFEQIYKHALVTRKCELKYVCLGKCVWKMWEEMSTWKEKHKVSYPVQPLESVLNELVHSGTETTVL